MTGFGSAALSQTLLHHLRTHGAGLCVILSPLAARAHSLRALLDAEGLGDARVMTCAEYAAELANHPGPGATLASHRWLLFFKALEECDMEPGWQALTGDDEALEALHQLLDALRANFVASSDLEALQDSYPAAGFLAALLGSYERNLGARNAADLPQLIRTAVDKTKQGSVKVPGLYVFDSVHEARPDEFELTAALAASGAKCLFLCDTAAPAPADRSVVRDAASELARRIGTFKTEAATPSPNEELGRAIAEGSSALSSLLESRVLNLETSRAARAAPERKLKGENRADSIAQLLQFNDLATQLRALARAARKLTDEEGVAAREIAFFVTGGAAQAQLLHCELERARALPLSCCAVQRTGVSRAALRANALEREVRLILNLLTDPQKKDLRLKVISSGMAEDESQLEEKLARLFAEKEALGLEKLLGKAFDSLLPDLNELEKEALDVYRRAAADFAALAGTGDTRNDVALFTSALAGYLKELSREEMELPDVFLTPHKPPVRHYSAVFLPSLVRRAAALAPAWVGIDRLAGALERKLGRPVYLPTSHTLEARERYDYASAAAAGGQVVLAFYRQERGRATKPLPWLPRAAPLSCYPVQLSASSIAGASRAALRAVDSRQQTVDSKQAPSTVYRLPSTIPTISAIADYVTCPHLFYLRRILRLKGPESERMTLGSLIHQALAAFHDPGETDLSVERMRRLLDKLAQNKELAPESLEEARALLEAYVADGSLGIESTLAVESPFELNFGGAKIRGRIDRVAAAGGGVKIIDYKTSGEGKQAKHKNAVVKKLSDIQLPLYTLAMREAGHHVEAFSYIYLNHEGTSMPYEASLQFSEEKGRDTISEAQLQESLKRIENVIGEILAGRLVYEKGENAPCARRGWCDFAAMCSFAQEM